MKQWLVSVAAASILSAAALTLCPEGRVRAVTRLVCGIVCALALASPVLQLDITTLSAAMSAYGQAAQTITFDAEEERKMLERTYIEDKCAAYISDKAAALGIPDAAASVLARWDEEQLVWYPYETAVACAENEALSRIIEAELGVPASRQSWLAE